MRLVALGLLVLLAGPPHAQGAVLATLGDRAAFDAAAAAAGLTVCAAVPRDRPSPFVAETFFPRRATQVRVEALPAGLVVAGGRLSSEVDRAVLRLEISGARATVRGIGLGGGITDLGFDWLDGSIAIQVIGQGELLATSTPAGPGFAGMITSTAIRGVVIRVESFDRDASAVAYATLDQLVLATPVPAALPLAATGIAMLLGLRTRRHRHARPRG